MPKQKRILLTPEEKMQLFVQKASAMDDRQLAINLLSIIHYRVEDRSNRLSDLIKSLSNVVEVVAEGNVEDFDKILTVVTPKIVQLVECQIENDQNLVKIFEALNKNGQVQSSRRQREMDQEPATNEIEEAQTLKDHTSIFDFPDEEETPLTDYLKEFPEDDDEWEEKEQEDEQ